jgi:hypothetical protein
MRSVQASAPTPAAIAPIAATTSSAGQGGITSSSTTLPSAPRPEPARSAP